MCSLSRAEHEVMLAAKMMLMRRMMDNLADKVLVLQKVPSEGS